MIEGCWSVLLASLAACTGLGGGRQCRHTAIFQTLHSLPKVPGQPRWSEVDADQIHG